MIDYFANGMSCLFEATITFMLFEAFFIKRNYINSILLFFSTILLGILIYVSNMFFNFGILNVVILMILAFIYSFLFEGNMRDRIILSISVFVLSGIIEMLVLGGMIIFSGYTADEIVSGGVLRLMGVFLSKLLLFIVIKLIALSKKQSSFTISTSYWTMFVAVLITSLLTISLIFKIQMQMQNEKVIVFSIIILIGIMYNVFFTLFLYEKMSEQAEKLKKQKLLEQQTELQIKHFDEILLSQKKIRKIRHDLVNHMISLRGFFKKEENEKGIKYIEEILKMADVSSEITDTGNTAIDTIISAKRDVAESKKIKFTYNVQLPQSIEINPIDMCVLLGNALDNAIEANDRDDVNDNKYIELSLVFSDNMLICRIINSSFEKVSNGFKTKKKNKKDHGIGLENIRSIIKKYNGEMRITSSNNIFELDFSFFI